MSAVVLQGAELRLVRRGSEPSKGGLDIPGWIVELGATVKEAVMRAVETEDRGWSQASEGHRRTRLYRKGLLEPDHFTIFC
ncbi:MAG: hypothetical protein QGF78_05360 [Candidatus Bathyarchaeota archaeon]|nr:hypothetical protein [Candidatus Bathyarchaeota archaeon]